MDTSDVEALSAEKRALLDRRLRGIARGRPSALPSVERRAAPGRTPLSPAQEQLWYFSRLAPDNPVYNEVVSIRKDGPLAVSALRAAFNALVSRHEIWRSTFSVADGEPVQLVHPAATLELPLIDLADLPAAEREPTAVRMAAAQARLPYDLEHGPLLRPLLMRLSEDHHRLYLAMHHLIFDGVSLYRIVLPELVALYDDLSAGREPTLPAPVTQYGAYAASARHEGEGADHRRRVAHWRRHLADAPPLQLPMDHPRPARQRFRGSMERLRISRESADGLRSLSRTSGATLFQVLAAAFSVLLHRYSEQEDVVFGTLVDMRDRRELEGMVGYCLTPLVLRVNVTGQPSFAELLGRVQDELLDGITHLMPFGRLVRDLHPRRVAAINPLFQVAITLEPAMVAVDPAWSLHQMEAEASDAVGNAKFDLLLELDERPEGHLDGRLIFDGDLFEPATVSRLARHWLAILDAAVAQPDRPVSELPLLTDEQQHRELADSTGVAMPFPHDRGLHELVADQAARTPDAVAVVFDDEQLTYRELVERARRLAVRLAAHNPERQLVAILLDRSPDMLVGMLAILQSGAAYLPLDLSHPAARLSLMLEDSGAGLLLTDTELRRRLPDAAATVVCIDEPPGGAPQPAALPAVSSADLAYVLYTSGSTGRPKGVCVTHRSVVHLLTAAADQPGISADDTMLAITTYGFDIAAVELWLPLITGARLVMASREVAADGRRLVALLDRREITIMQATPATWQMMVDAGWRGRRGLTAISIGEALPPRLATALLDRVQSLWNMYGPTETTVWSTGERVAADSPITIGRPIANTRVYILGRHRQPVPAGVAGELAIAGEGVAAGYLGRPELTRERFLPDTCVAGATMYLTGDLARRRPDGRIEHLGRLDHQIKIRGFRVEPGEIEAALTQAPDVADAVVIARGDGPAETRLIAYVVPRGTPPSPAALRARLRAVLPDYMVPTTFVSIDGLPVSANGKLDRAALPEPRIGSPARPDPPRPHTAGEAAMARIWERVLGVPHVEVDADFFELGGHSLLALRLLVEVERELGVEVPVSAFFSEAHATVAGLAAAVERAAAPATAPRASGSSPSLFFVHPHTSTMLIMRHFAAPLGADWQLVGLLPDRVAGRFDRSQTVEAIVAPMLDTVRRTQPHGPYYIAGYSLGGLLAYELAGALRAAGERVAWLGILDSATPAADTRWFEREFSLRRRIARQWQRGPRGAWAELEQNVRRELTRRLIRLGLRRAPDAEEFDWFGAIKLVMRYPCPPHDAPMDLFVTEARAEGARSDSLGWQELHAGRLRVHRVSGSHDDMVTPGHIAAVAELVSAGANEARSARAGG